MNVFCFNWGNEETPLAQVGDYWECNMMVQLMILHAIQISNLFAQGSQAFKFHWRKVKTFKLQAINTLGTTT